MEQKQATLAELRPGHRANIVGLRGESAFKRRLAELGITPGCMVLTKKVAPFGDPIEIEIRGYQLVLRGKDAKNILVDNERRT